MKKFVRLFFNTLLLLVVQIFFHLFWSSASPFLTSIDAAELELFMANPEVRIAQKIYCQIKNVDPTDKLQAILDGIAIFEKSANLQPEEIFVSDYQSLQAGNHRLLVQIQNVNNEIIAGQTREWTTLHNGIPKVGINEHNAICINGIPYFPITSWMLKKSDFDSPIASCINILLAVGWYEEHNIDTWKDYLAIAQTYDFYVAGPNRWDGFNKDDPRNSDTDKLIDYVMQTKNYTDNLIAWYWDDEPDLGDADKYNPATTIHKWTRLTHQYDTNHPVWINFTGYNFTRNESRWHHDRIKEYCYLYNADKFEGEKTAVTDIFSIDYYPYEYANKVNMSEWISLEDYALALDRAREWNYDLFPTIAFIETQDLHDYNGVGHDKPCGWPKDYSWTPDPTPEELNNLIWLSIVHGVKGLSLFHYFCPIPDENIEILRNARYHIEHLTPVILGPDSKKGVSIQELNGGHVDIMVKEYHGNPFIFAVNIERKSETVRFTVEGLDTEKNIHIYNEERTITVSGGYFEDSFEPLGVHIYIIPLGSRDIIPPKPPTGLQVREK